MSIYELVDQRMKILNSNYSADDLGPRYNYYLETVCAFEGTKEELLEIIMIYSAEIKEYILSNPQIVDVIMQEEDLHRHDLDINDEVDFEQVLDDLFTNQEVSGFSERAQHVILLESMNMYNTYGIKVLRTNQEQVKKEMTYGIYRMKTDPDKEFTDERAERVEGTAHATRNYEEIMRLGDKHGKEALKYIEHLELLQKRVNSLVDLVGPTLQKDVIKLSETIARIIEAKNAPDSVLQFDAETLDDLFITYNKVNFLTMRHLMAKNIPGTIDKPTGELLMLHFIQDEEQSSFDKEMNAYLENEAIITAKKMISELKGRPYNETLDQKDLENLLEQYHESRDNPVDFTLRIPLRCKYIGKSGGVGFAQVITKPTTLLSVSVSTPEDLSIHLKRRIAIGFLPDDIPLEAVAATSKRFNFEKDRIEFSRGRHSITEIMNYNRENNNTNETLVDWTKVKPGYILVVKDKEMLEPEIFSRAQQLGEKNNLPVVIYDAYAIKRNTNITSTVNYQSTTNTKQ